MPFDPERLRALAEAKRAKDENNAARELAQFESERLAPFLAWLEVELERIAEFGYLGATLHLKVGYGEGLGEGLGWDASVGPSDDGSACGCSDSVRLGSQFLPIQQIATCVIESLSRCGLKAELRPLLETDILLAW